jgi:predicted nucleotidyltransferase
VIAVSTAELTIVRQILQTHVPECEVRAFGSRVRGTHKPHSDLDLVVIGAARLPVPRLGLLQEAFRDSTLPFRVDVLDWHAIPASFPTVIDAGYETAWP